MKDPNIGQVVACATTYKPVVSLVQNHESMATESTVGRQCNLTVSNPLHIATVLPAHLKQRAGDLTQ